MDEHIADALAKGARLIMGGKRREGSATELYYEPTVLDGVMSSMLVSTDETFGPIVPIQTIRSEQEAIDIATRSKFGLSIAVFSEDLKRALRISEALRAGTVIINDTTNWFEYHIPFGGGAGTQSGIGRVGGRFGLERFMDSKTVFVDMS